MISRDEKNWRGNKMIDSDWSKWLIRWPFDNCIRRTSHNYGKCRVTLQNTRPSINPTDPTISPVSTTDDISSLSNLIPRLLCSESFPIEYPDSWYDFVTSGYFYSNAAFNQNQMVGVIIAENKSYKQVENTKTLLYSLTLNEYSDTSRGCFNNSPSFQIQSRWIHIDTRCR